MSPDELRTAMRTWAIAAGRPCPAIGVSRSAVSLWLEGKVGVPPPGRDAAEDVWSRRRGGRSKIRSSGVWLEAAANVRALAAAKAERSALGFGVDFFVLPWLATFSWSRRPLVTSFRQPSFA